MTQSRIGVGLYGTNGHQLGEDALRQHPVAELIGTYATLDELLAEPRVQLASLCSPRRRDQARDSIRCLEAGKHVYAEKPAAFTDEELDEVLAVARQTGFQFREMAGIALDHPYCAMRRLVAAGTIGTVIQVHAQKSYPLHERRPPDEDVDGGLMRQAGVHAVRMIEHVAATVVRSVQAVETPGSGLRLAAALLMTLENGGIATATANYLNPTGFGRWGNETLRIWGDRGMVEAVDGGERTRLVVGDHDRGPLDLSEPAAEDHFTLYAKSLLGLGAMPLSAADELHPTRIVCRGKVGCDTARR